jgi:hypothetical protein
LNLLTGHEIFISRSETSKKLLLPWGLKKLGWLRLIYTPDFIVCLQCVLKFIILPKLLQETESDMFLVVKPSN